MGAPLLGWRPILIGRSLPRSERSGSPQPRPATCVVDRNTTWRTEARPATRALLGLVEGGALVVDGGEEGDQVVQELVARAGGARVVVRVRALAVDQGQPGLGDPGLSSEDPGGVQDALTAKGRAEGVDRHALAEVVAVDRVDAEDRLRRVGVPVGDRARVDGQAQRVVPGAAVHPGEPRAGEHAGVPLDRSDLTGRVPPARVAAGGEMPGVHLRGDERGGRGLGVHPKPNCASLVAGTGGFRLAGSNGNVCASEGPFGSMTAAVEPVAEKRPRNGAGIPPKASHGVPFWRFWSDWVACSGDTGTGLLPPSMNTRPERSLAPGLP